MITRELIRKALEQKQIQIVVDPQNRNDIVAQIGFLESGMPLNDNDYIYFGGITGENSSPEEYVKNVPAEDITEEIFESLESFRQSPYSDLQTAYKRYENTLNRRVRC